MSKIYKVTKDISADYRKLRALEVKGKIKVINIRIENNRDRESATLPTGVFDHTVLDYMLLGSEEQAEIFERLKQIIGPQNIEDCIHVEAHIRDKNDYFVTEDADILKKREELESKFPILKIRTVEELLSELGV